MIGKTQYMQSVFLERPAYCDEHLVRVRIQEGFLNSLSGVMIEKRTDGSEQGVRAYVA